MVPLPKPPFRILHENGQNGQNRHFYNGDFVLNCHLLGHGSSKSTKMAKIDVFPFKMTILAKMAKMVQKWPKWPKMGQKTAPLFGHRIWSKKWSKNDILGHFDSLPKIDQNGPKMTLLVIFEPFWKWSQNTGLIEPFFVTKKGVCGPPG